MKRGDSKTTEPQAMEAAEEAAALRTTEAKPMLSPDAQEESLVEIALTSAGKTLSHGAYVLTRSSGANC